MKKLIFRNFNLDILKFFITSLLVMGLIVWTIQAVKFFDFVTVDGHGLSVYFSYIILNFPKILHRILPFIFFITIFYVITSYEQKNELSIFWLNGISKLEFTNKLIIISIFFMLSQIIMGSFISPISQFKARSFLKDSNIDLFNSLLEEKKFINSTRGLTIFVNKKNEDGTYENVFLEEIKNDSSKIIVAKNGVLRGYKDRKIFQLSDGKVVNKSNDNIKIFNFDIVNFDLSEIKTNTIIIPKIQEIKTSLLINCLLNLENGDEKVFECKRELRDEIKIEIMKRFYKPLYIPLIALLSCFLILYPKNHINYRKFRNFIFFINFIIIIISEASLKYSIKSSLNLMIFIVLPLLIFLISYLIFYKNQKNV